MRTMKLKSAFIVAATFSVIAFSGLNLGCSSSDDEKGDNTKHGGTARHDQTHETSVTLSPSSTDAAGAGVGTGSGTGTGVGTTDSATGVAGTSTDDGRGKSDQSKLENKLESKSE
jgi:hypothetical protein